MTQQLVLSGPELDLILELLQSQQKELRVEIRHTDSADFRAGLKGRMATVESLIQQIQRVQQNEAVGTP